MTTTLEAPVKQKKPKTTKPKKSELFFVKRELRILTKEGNQSLRNKRITNISLYMLKVWICRFITWEDNKNIQDFGIDTSKNELSIWFRFKIDAEKCEKLMDDIAENGHPIYHKYNQKPV